MLVFRLQPLHTHMLAFAIYMYAALAMLKLSSGDRSLSLSLSGSDLPPFPFPPTLLIENFMKKMACELNVEVYVGFQQVEMTGSRRVEAEAGSGPGGGVASIPA